MRPPIEWPPAAAAATGSATGIALGAAMLGGSTRGDDAATAGSAACAGFLVAGRSAVRCGRIDAPAGTGSRSAQYGQATHEWSIAREQLLH